MTQNLCRYNKFGFCKFSDKCRFRHNNVLCKDKKCSVFNCKNRHPKICTYLRDFGRCKFTTFCKYNHEKQNDVKENSERIKDIEKKVIEIETKVKNPSNEDLAKTIDMKIETFENQLKHLRKVIDEKDKCISTLRKRLEMIGNKLNGDLKQNNKELETLIIENEKKLETINIKLDKVEEIVRNREKKFKCHQCNFMSESEQGLKTHISRKHKSENKKEENLDYPRSCELCEKEIKNIKEMKKHLKTHSFRYVQYKCNFCNYYADDDIGIAVHVGNIMGEIL